MKVPTQEELGRQIASGEEDSIIGLPSQGDQYKQYLEEQKELLAYMLLEGMPLSGLDRKEIAYLLCPDLLKPAKKTPGRPRGTDKTFRRDMKITLEYEALYTKGGSEAAFVELQDKYGFKDRSSILKAINRVNRFRGKKPRSKSSN